MDRSDSITYEDFLAAQRRAKRRRITMIVCAIVMGLSMITAIAANFVDGYMSMGSFAVDSEGLLYVGFDDDILVYRDGQLLHEFTALPGMAEVDTRDNVFTINEKDELVLTTEGTVYRLDLQGNVLGTEQTGTGLIAPELSFVAANGDVYTKEHALGRATLVKNGTETVFQMPMETFVLRSVWLTAFAVLFVGAMILIGLLVSGTGSMKMVKARHRKHPGKEA